MANNRMWLVCRVCNAKFLLAKTYGIYGTFQEENLHIELNKFFKEHAFSCNDETDTISADNGFKLCYDHAEDEGIEEI